MNVSSLSKDYFMNYAKINLAISVCISLSQVTSPRAVTVRG